MADFVLAAGAWLGSWAWDEVVPELRAAGHGAHPVTLSGLAEKQRVRAGRQTHVQDIVGEVEGLDLHDVVLVGHSYASIPVGQAAGRICGRLACVVFIDGPVPAQGQSCLSSWPDGGRFVKAAIAENGGFWMPPDRAGYYGHGLTDEQIDRIMGGSTPHPGATLTEPAVLTCPVAELPGTYITCLLGGAEPKADVAELGTGGQWRVVEMETGHWPMFSQPRELARILLDAAGA
ncbi:alpha/beta hydrolase [Streptomyces sp. ISL-10]|uniref:alpha/beta fold hydrolase n=1 Tax=Streptomyces sp. ISL-10 TaxID=2819172 RepID=UPI001BE52AE3|nr:alpha/beta hydrolase [Streptomyces sp. ISL-10]MBT2368933.1 alpha/beta hydrolase [Streptomyces sp. ISL-10]